MMEDEEWIVVRRPYEKELWRPTDENDDGSESSEALKVTFKGPATHWTDALPIGNGRLGAMLWGAVASETIQLNGTHQNVSLVL